MLIDRDEELTTLVGLLDELGTSGGKVVLIRGEAGIGKTALTNELLGRVEDDAHVLLGACDDLLTPQPHAPFWDIGRSEASVAKPLRANDRRGVFDAVLELLSRRLRPTVLVIEDTQWADEATLDVIKFLGRRIGRTNGLLILTYRDGEVDIEHPLRQVIGELPASNLVRIRLDHLSTEAVALLVQNERFDVDEVMELTGGNPLFVTELVRAGMDAVPLSVQDSVLARAAKLPERARAIIDLVSVTPGSTERHLVEELLEPTSDEIAACARQGLLQWEGDRVSFHHELTRRAVESALSEFDRRRINGLILDRLADGATPSRLVHHAREAHDVDAIIEFAPKAARAAMDSESHREALAHFHTLEPFLNRIATADRAAIVDDWARNEFYMDNIEALAILDRAIELHRTTGDDHALARALTFSVRLNEVNGRPEAAEAASREALDILEKSAPGSDLAFAVAQRGWLLLMRGDLDRAVELADRAAEIAESVGDELTIIHTLNTKGCAIAIRGEASGFRMLEQSRRRAGLVGFGFEETRALINMTSCAVEARDLTRAVDFVRRARETAARYEIRALEAYSRANYAEILEWQGHWDAAEDTAAEVLGSHPHVEVLAGWVLGTLWARRNRRKARDMLERTWSLAEANAETQNRGPAAAAWLEYMWLSGHRDDRLIAASRRVLGELLEQGFAWVAGSVAFWLWKLDESEAVPSGIAEPYRLMMSGDSERAATLWEEKGFPYEQALALMHGGRSDKTRALRIFDELGAVATAERMRRRLREQGVRVPRGPARSTREHVAGLTQRQAEVLELLGEGLSNLDIADRLFLSPRTVENHVSAVLAKLDSSSREEAVARARSEGLLAS